MKKVLFLMTLLVMGVSFAFAHKQMPTLNLTKQPMISVSFPKTVRLSVAHSPLLISVTLLW